MSGFSCTREGGDGSTIAFDLPGDIYTMPISGGKATPLTRGMASATVLRLNVAISIFQVIWQRRAPRSRLPSAP